MNWDIEKQRLHYADQQRIFNSIMREFVKLQQIVAGMVNGSVTDAEIRKRTRKFGRALATVQLIAKPETIRLMQNYSFSCLKVVTDEMQGNVETALQKALWENEPVGARKEQLGGEYAQRVVKNIGNISVKISSLVNESAPILLAVRAELGIETNEEEFTRVVADHALNGENFLKEIGNKFGGELNVHLNRPLEAAKAIRNFWG
jgi:hypothetical protein